MRSRRIEYFIAARLSVLRIRRALSNRPDLRVRRVQLELIPHGILPRSLGMPDDSQTIGELKALIDSFAQEREWEPFHSLKNLSMSISIESAELMEHFQWIEGKESDAVAQDDAKRTQVEEELADVIIYALQFANRSGIDLSSAIRRKVEINARKYPVEKSRGRSTKPERS